MALELFVQLLKIYGINKYEFSSLILFLFLQIAYHSLTLQIIDHGAKHPQRER